MSFHITRPNGFVITEEMARQRHIADLSNKLGFHDMHIFRYDGSSENEEALRARIDGIIAGITNKDTVVIQLPTGNGLNFETCLMRRIKVYEGMISVIINDWSMITEPYIELYYSYVDTIFTTDFAIKKELCNHYLLIKKPIYYKNIEVKDDCYDLLVNRMLIEIQLSAANRDCDYLDFTDIALPLQSTEILFASAHCSYNNKVAVSFEVSGTIDGVLVYAEDSDTPIYETEDTFTNIIYLDGTYQCITLKAFVRTKKGYCIVSESPKITVISSLSVNTADKYSVSVVIPAYNVEMRICNTIDSVLGQSDGNVEILIVNDGSKDNTRTIAEWYASMYSNVKVINKENGGVSSARNTGINEAKGEYISFLDADDAIRPFMIERMYQKAVTQQCDIVACGHYWVRDGRITPAYRTGIDENSAADMSDYLKAYPYMYDQVMVWNKIYKTSLVKRHPFPPEPFEDEAWTPYIFSYAKRIGYVNECLYNYYKGILSDSLSERQEGFAIDTRFEYFKKAIMFYITNGSEDYFENLCTLAMTTCKRHYNVYRYHKYLDFPKEIQTLKDSNLSGN